MGGLENFNDNLQFNTKFDGQVKDFEIRKAHFPWVSRLKEIYWIFSGFTSFELGTPIVVIHDQMTPQATFGTLFHELMHVFYDKSEDDANGEKFIQEKAIENIIKIQENFRWIVHPRNDDFFRQQSTARNAMSYGQISSARTYLKIGYDLHFYSYRE